MSTSKIRKDTQIKAIVYEKFGSADVLEYREVAWLGIVASLLGVSGILLGLIIPNLLVVLTGGILIMMFYEIALGIWLLSRKKNKAITLKITNY